MMQLRNVRKSRGLTQRQLADLVGLHQGTISRIETGRQDVSLRTLRKIARILEVSPAELLEDDPATEVARGRGRALEPGRDAA